MRYHPVFGIGRISLTSKAAVFGGLPPVVSCMSVSQSLDSFKVSSLVATKGSCYHNSEFKIKASNNQKSKGIIIMVPVVSHKEAMEIEEYLPNNSKMGDFNLQRTLSTLFHNH